MKKLNLLLDLSLQFLVACMAAIIVIGFLKPQAPPSIVAVDLDDYVDQLQRDWQTGTIDETKLKQTLKHVKQAIATIPTICPNTVVMDSKSILADNMVVHIDAEDLQTLDDMSPKEQRLYLQSILGCKK